MKRQFYQWSASFAFALLAALAASVASAVPLQVAYHGDLRFSDGSPAEGTFDVAVAIFSSGPNPAGPGEAESPLWEEVLGDVAVTDGHLDLVLGTNSGDALAAALAGASSAWLQVWVDGEPLLPRQRVMSVPYSLHAMDAEMLGGVPAAEYLTVTDLETLKPITAGNAAPVAISNDYADLDGLPDLGGFLRADGSVPLAADLDAFGYRIRHLAVDAGPTPPVAISQGQLWWDSQGGALQVYDGDDWQPASQAGASLTGGKCPSGQVAVGTTTAGGPLCEKLPNLSANSVNTDAIQNGSVTADKLGIDCEVGQLLVRTASGWSCANPAGGSPGANLLINAGLSPSSTSGGPTGATADISAANLKVQKLTDGELSLLLGASAGAEQGMLHSMDLRSTKDGTSERVAMYPTMDPATAIGVTVTCSVWARHVDAVGTMAKAKLSCFGVDVEKSIPLTDKGWHQLVVTTKVPAQSAAAPAVFLYGSGPVVKADSAFVRYALPKVEFGESASAWNPGGSGGGSGGIMSPSALPHQSVTVYTNDTTTDLGDQINALLERYAAVTLRLQHDGVCCKTYTWNRRVNLRPFQNLVVIGEGYTNGGGNIKVEIHMTKNPTVTTNNTLYKSVVRLRGSSYSGFSLFGVVLRENQNDPLPLHPSHDHRGLFLGNGRFGQLDLRQLQAYTTEHLVNIGEGFGYMVRFGHTKLYADPKATKTVHPVTADKGWSFGGQFGWVAKSHTSLGTGVEWLTLDTSAGGQARLTYFN